MMSAGCWGPDGKGAYVLDGTVFVEVWGVGDGVRAERGQEFTRCLRLWRCRPSKRPAATAAPNSIAPVQPDVVASGTIQRPARSQPA